MAPEKLHLTYVIDGEEQTVYFEGADFDPQNEFEKDVDGANFWLWSVTGRFNETTHNTSTSIFWGSVTTARRISSTRYFVSLGARTEAANLPAGIRDLCRPHACRYLQSA